MQAVREVARAVCSAWVPADFALYARSLGKTASLEKCCWRTTSWSPTTAISNGREMLMDLMTVDAFPEGPYGLLAWGDYNSLHEPEPYFPNSGVAPSPEALRSGGCLSAFGADGQAHTCHACHAHHACYCYCHCDEGNAPGRSASTSQAPKPGSETHQSPGARDGAGNVGWHAAGVHQRSTPIPDAQGSVVIPSAPSLDGVTCVVAMTSHSASGRTPYRGAGTDTAKAAAVAAAETAAAAVAAPIRQPAVFSQHQLPAVRAFRAGGGSGGGCGFGAVMPVAPLGPPSPSPQLPLGIWRPQSQVCGSGLRGVAAAAPNVSLELQRCISVRQIQDVVNRHWSHMRPMHHAEVVMRLGLLTYGSRSEERGAARRLAAECTVAALAAAARGSGGGSGRSSSSSSSSMGINIEVLKVLLQGWAWVRKPPYELLVRLLEALVPGSSSGLLGAAGGHQEQMRTVQAAEVRHGYGRLHTATLQDAAALVEPLAALDALTPPLLDVLINVAVRRAGNETSAAVAAAATAYGRAGVVDPRVTQAFLEATAATRRRRVDGGGGVGSASAGHIAEVLGLCAKAAWYDPRVFAQAADALVACGVGELTRRQIWAVLRAFVGARHEHPMLTNALATHAKTLLIDVDGPPSTAPATAADHDSSSFDDGINELYGSGGGGGPATVPAPHRELDPVRQLTRELSMLAGLVNGFCTMQVYDKELYGCLAAGAAALLRRAATAALGESHPRAVAAALTALLSGFAGVGIYPTGLLDVMAAQQHGWMRSVSVEQTVTLTCALAELRNRDERLLDRLDLAAAVFLENAISTAAAASGLIAPAAAGRGGNGAAAAAATSVPDVSWLPAFLNAACRRLSYPCPRTVAALAAAAAVWEQDAADASPVLRPLSKGEKKLLKENKKAARTSDSTASETLSRLQVLLRVVLEQGRNGAAVAAATADAANGDGGYAAAAAAAGPIKPRWVCELLSGLACSCAQLRGPEEQDLAWLLARSIELAVGAAPAEEETSLAAAAAAAAPANSGQRRWLHRRPLTPVQAATSLDDAAACNLFRAVVASQYRRCGEYNRREEEEGGGGGGGGETRGETREWNYLEGEDPGRSGGGGGDGGEYALRGGLELALHRALTPPVAAALLARASRAWHAAGLGTAAPQPPDEREAAPAAAVAATAGWAATGSPVAAAVPLPLSPEPRRPRRRGGGIDVAQSPVLSELLRSLGLPVFEQWETSDGLFRVARGVVLPGGRNVGLEVLPDTAFAAANTSGASLGGDGVYLVLIGDAAFRARCLASRGWRLVALPEGEWAAAEVAGPAACMALMRRRSGAL